MKPVLRLSWGLALFVLFTNVPAFAGEKSLMGIFLGENLDETVTKLTKKYGKSEKFSQSAMNIHRFPLDQAGKNFLIVGSAQGPTKWIGHIEVQGKQAISDLNFLGGVNLGTKTDAIEKLLPGAVTKKSPDGARKFHDYPGVNYFLESEKGLVSSIAINMVGQYPVIAPDEGRAMILSPTELEILASFGENQKDNKEEASRWLERLSKDELKDHCEMRYPIYRKNGVYLVKVTVGNLKTRAEKIHTFLLDTGWSQTAIDGKICKETNCKIIPGASNEMGENISGSGGLYGLANRFFTFGQLRLLKTDVVKKVGAEAVLGGEFFSATPMVFNLRNEYVCFPRISLEELAKKVPSHQLPAVFDAGRIWIDFTANGKPVKDYFIDTGSNITSFLKKDIETLGLKVNGKHEGLNIDGKYKTNLYGPVTLGWPELSMKLESVSVATSDDFRKFGTDFLQFFHLGIEPKTKRIYFFK
ncbi:MAG: hypothetical protein JNL01_11140 [Bdellovibrionales bacterium]|nr:hypothetical protein [Bdellovibrionales bacterium]